MNKTVEKLVAEALEMPPHLRAFVVEKLIESLDVAPGIELSDAWRAELSERCREMDEGIADLCEAEAVFARAYAALR